jgi:hypothetical protein
LELIPKEAIKYSQLEKNDDSVFPLAYSTVYEEAQQEKDKIITL